MSARSLDTCRRANGPNAPAESRYQGTHSPSQVKPHVPGSRFERRPGWAATLISGSAPRRLVCSPALPRQPFQTEIRPDPKHLSVSRGQLDKCLSERVTDPTNPANNPDSRVSSTSRLNCSLSVSYRSQRAQSWRSGCHRHVFAAANLQRFVL